MSRVVDKDRNSLYINKNEDYPQVPLRELPVTESFNYNSIQKDENSL